MDRLQFRESSNESHQLSREDSFNVPHGFSTLNPDTNLKITPSSSQGVSDVNASYSRRLFIGSKRSLVVHLLPKTTGSLSPGDQLAVSARIAIPGICNFLYFGAAKVAVVYLGKQKSNEGDKEGIPGAEELKRNLLKYMTSEIWPPLRADVPDDHPADTPQNGVSLLQMGGMHALIYLKRCQNNTGYVKILLRSTGRIHFDVVDKDEKGTRWESRKLHIRMLDSLETQKAIFSYEDYVSTFRTACEKALRQPALVFQRFRFGDAFQEEGADGKAAEDRAHQHIEGLGEETTSPIEVSGADGGGAAAHGGGDDEDDDGTDVVPSPRRLGHGRGHLKHTGSDDAYASPAAGSEWGSIKVQWNDPEKRHYKYFDMLTSPESVTLDYKSYYGDPMGEIEEKGVKFMCGFLNAYGHGKLVVGVHELPTKGEEAKKLDQVVVGANVTKKGIQRLARALESQLLDCVPPIPPNAVRIELVPVILPITEEQNATLLVFPNTDRDEVTKELRQRTNNALRVLCKYNKALCQLNNEDLPPEIRGKNVTAFCVVDGPAVSNPPSNNNSLLTSPGVSPPTHPQPPPNVELEPPTDQEEGASPMARSEKESFASTKNWQKDLRHSVGGGRWKTHAVIEEVSVVKLPKLFVIELSVDRARASGSFDMKGYSDKGGKYFNGWPSIPLWNVATNSVGRIERNYHMFSQCSFGVDGLRGGSSAAARRPATLGGGLGFRSGRYADLGELTAYLSNWYDNSEITLCVLKFLDTGLKRLRGVRILSRAFNASFEDLAGKDIVNLLELKPGQTSICIPDNGAIRQAQQALMSNRLFTLPLLLAWIYGQIGGLPSPYPYQAVPLSMTHIRLRPELVPLYWVESELGGRAGIQPGFHGAPNRAWDLRTAVVYDGTDGILKLPNYDPVTGDLKSVEPIVGVAFDSFYPDEVSRWKGGKVLVRFTFLPLEKGHHQAPWGLKNLLLWLHTMASDSHVHFAGSCQRFLGYTCNPTTEVCMSHYASPGSVSSPSRSPQPVSSPLTAGGVGRLALQSFDCVLHMAEQSWIQWEWTVEASKLLKYDC